MGRERERERAAKLSKARSAREKSAGAVRTTHRERFETLIMGRTCRLTSRKGAKKLYGVKRENPNKSKNKGGRPRKVQAVDRVAQLEEQVDSLEEFRARKAQLEEELIRTRRAHEREREREMERVRKLREQVTGEKIISSLQEAWSKYKERDKLAELSDDEKIRRVLLLVKDEVLPNL